MKHSGESANFSLNDFGESVTRYQVRSNVYNIYKIWKKSPPAQSIEIHMCGKPRHLAVNVLHNENSILGSHHTVGILLSDLYNNKCNYRPRWSH